MQESLVVLECLRRSSEKRILTRVYRQLYNPDFYKPEYSREIVDALKAERYRMLESEHLSELKSAVAAVLGAVYQVEFKTDKILGFLKEVDLKAEELSDFPLEIKEKIDDGRFWHLVFYLKPWKAYFPTEKVLIWDEGIYRFSPDGDVKSFLLEGLGLRWQKGRITLDPSFKAKLLRPYMREGKPIHRSSLLNLPMERIISFYKEEEKKFKRLLSLLSKPSEEADMLYILQRSLEKTLACKYRTSTKEIRKRLKLIQAD